MGIIIVYRCRVAGECFGENPAWIHACDRIAAVLPTSGKGLQGMNGYAEETVMPKKRRDDLFWECGSHPPAPCVKQKKAGKAAAGRGFSGG